MRVHFIVKNRVQEEDFERLAFDWLSKGDYTPDDIIESITTEHNLMLFPIHHFKSSYLGTCSASLGYVTRKPYLKWNAEHQQQEEKYKTTIEWRPYIQDVSGDTEITIYSGDPKSSFLSNFFEETNLELYELLPLDSQAEVNPKLLNLFKPNPIDTWNNKAVIETRELIYKKLKKNLPSKLVRDYAPNFEFQVEEVTSLLLPFWVFMYDYKGKPYYVAVDANNPINLGIGYMSIFSEIFLFFGLLFASAASVMTTDDSDAGVIRILFILFMYFLPFLIIEILNSISKELTPNELKIKQHNLSEIEKHNEILEKYEICKMNY